MLKMMQLVSKAGKFREVRALDIPLLNYTQLMNNMTSFASKPGDFNDYSLVQSG